MSKLLPDMTELCKRSEKDAEIVVVCRKGHDSQIVAHELKKTGIPVVRDLKGGLQAFAKDADPSFLTY